MIMSARDPNPPDPLREAFWILGLFAFGFAVALVLVLL